jgi:FtsP/CotA-like multicopper oxidase with cupredoxin domain
MLERLYIYVNLKRIRMHHAYAGGSSLLTRFEDYANASARYMFHCHLLAHEDRG